MYLVSLDSHKALVVDPCDAAIVLQALQMQELTLDTILVTHHHGDHVGGVTELKAKTGCRVLAPESKRIPDVDQVMRDGEVFDWNGVPIHVIATPGHTRTSVCYYLPTPGEAPTVFTGDTLFVGGCGRLFECDAATMWQSLQKLAALPDNTQVYCGHEYTLENLAFAQTIDPNYTPWQSAEKRVQQSLKAGGYSVPSTIGREKEINIFFRAGENPIQQALGLTGTQPAKVFGELRKRKDRY